MKDNSGEKKMWVCCTRTTATKHNMTNYVQQAASFATSETVILFK